MKRTFFFLAIAFACGGTQAAETMPAARAAAVPAAKAPATTTPTASSPSTAQARRELDQMRDQMRDLGRRMADLSTQLGEANPRAYAWRYLGDPDRAMLGIIMAPDAKGGVRIAGVTPGGPAAKAGVKNNDLLVAIDGNELTTRKNAYDDAIAEATAALDDLKVGQDVRVTLMRDGKKSDVVIKAERREPRSFAYALDGNEAHKIEFARNDVERIVHEARSSAGNAHEFARTFRVRMPWWGLNLASLDKDLGDYFGTDHGALVLSAEAETFPGLRSGDVVQSIDGETVADPEDAIRLLRDAPDGGEVKLQIVRQKKPATLTMKSPEFKALFPPLPPMAPLAPEAPETPVPPHPLHAAPAAPAVAPAPPVPPPPPVKSTPGAVY